MSVTDFSGFELVMVTFQIFCYGATTAASFQN